MKITELFQQSYQWKWMTKTATIKSAVFSIPDTELSYIVNFKKIKNIKKLLPKGYDVTTLEKRQVWECDFEIKSNSGEKLASFGITGTGNAAQVLATIIDIIKDLNAQIPTGLILYFTAFDESRIKLYTKIAQRLASKFEKYVDDMSVTNFLIFV